jgi:hypothetical protein
MRSFPFNKNRMLLKVAICYITFKTWSVDFPRFSTNFGIIIKIKEVRCNLIIKRIRTILVTDGATARSAGNRN